MDKDTYISYKIKKLKDEGYSNAQSQAIAISMEKERHKQQGGSVNIASINQGTGIQFNQDFANSYFTPETTPPVTKPSEVEYLKLPVKDITSTGQWSDRKVWRTQRPEWFLGKNQPVEGKDYNVIPYSQWQTYQNSPEYQTYMGSMQVGGQATVSPYALNYPTFMNNFEQSPYIQRPDLVTQPDFTGTPFSTTAFTADPAVTQQQLGSPYRFSDEMPAGTYNPPVQPTYNNTTRVNVFNPYAGVDLGGALNYAGQGFGSGNAYQATLGTGLSVLKGARNFLTGYASGKESKRVQQEMYNDLYNPKINYQALQQGGQITNAEMLTGQYITDEPLANYNIEKNEYVKRNSDNQVQLAVGEPHIKNGKEAAGIDVRLENGDKVLSNYTKIPAKNIKELKERYDISLKKGATFADAQKAYDRKLGIQKETDELSKLIERSGENSNTQDETTRILNDATLSKEIEASKKKLDLLNAPQAMMFEDLFNIQESLPKKGKPGELLDENGKPIAKEGAKKYQQGGEITELSKKFGITTERAQELLALQEGGEQVSQEEAQPVNQEQVLQFVVQSLQNGATPEEVVQQLTQNGIPQEIAVAVVEQVIQGSQQQESEMSVAQQGTGFSFATRYAPMLTGYDVTGSSILNQDTLTGVEQTQPYFEGQGYGAKMANVEDTIKLHDWYFNTETKKKAFREASKKQGEQPEIKAFQEAYNNEILKRGEKAGVSKSELNNIVEQVGFTGSGARQLDGKFGAFTSTRPLYDFSKSKAGEVKVEETPVTTVQTPEVINRNITKTAFPLLPDDLRIFPSALNPLYKEQIALGRAEPTKLTTEPFLASQEAQRQAEIARVQASGLPPQLQESVLAQGLATSQISANDAIAKVEMANQANQAQVDQFNIGQRSKENLTNAQFNQQYQNQMLGGLNAYESALRSYYLESNLQNRQNFKDVDAINLLNSQNENYQYIPGVGVQYNYTPTTNLALPSLSASTYDTMSASQIDTYKKAEIAKARAQANQGYIATVKTP